MNKTARQYWICQLLGWGGWTSLTLFVVVFYASNSYLKPVEKRNIFFGVLLIELSWNILSTHVLRTVLRKVRWIKLPTRRVILLFLLSVFLTGLLSYYGARTTARLTGLSLVQYDQKQDLKAAMDKEQELHVAGTDYYLNKQPTSEAYLAAQNIKKNTGWYRNTKGAWQYEEQNDGRFWWDIIITMILIALWLLLYMVWHYLERNRNDEVDKLSLEKTVKELELKTIKSHINPHFIFNSLNSIRALVDENPQRARTAITELSNILRSSMQVEKMETVPLRKELDIVRDYLALEHMRFEERLQVEMDIEEDTLEQPVPPMMLQTLVENAIKHGISKKIQGGTVRVIARFINNHFEMIVVNTGTLEGEPLAEGFGLTSTRDRLQLLFHGKADFQITRMNGSEVQAKVVMPVAF